MNQLPKPPSRRKRSMSDKFDLTADERKQLRTLLDSDDWKVVEKIHSAAIESARSLLESCYERFELHQGIVAGLRQFKEILHQWARAKSHEGLLDPAATGHAATIRSAVGSRG